ncbi:hypothetical protein KMZ93_13895 [Bradyrhizobium sediminis]|uniref:Uncharacterized protein n=1 Tax=Bradyrhizobium sediminis TaxID=2840469 RepID=A0A975RUK2_9BRAD|nr:hypothetical protein [Bradyrhizobium sediminis]QWG21147.1 hypothetical protein KMZ93_13895 [Bradyrhizobium sediminis]
MANVVPPKRPKPKRPEKMQKVPLPDGQTVVPGIDAIQEGLIGRVVVEWSRLEGMLDDMIWTLTGLSFEDGRVLTARTDAKSKIAMLQVLAPRYLTDPILAKVEEALVLTDSLRDDRNFIMHGSWGTIVPMNEATAVSLRAASAPGEITSESFSKGRMLEIIDRINQAKMTLLEALNAHPTSPYISEPQGPRG